MATTSAPAASATASATDAPASGGAGASSTGIHIHGVWLTDSYYADEGLQSALAGGDVADPGDAPGVVLTPTIDVWFVPAAADPSGHDAAQAFVRLGVSVAPHAQPTFRAGATYVALFTADSAPALPLQEFAWSNGVAYLVPFVRQRLLSLTGEGRYPMYLLPPISVESLLAMVGQAAGAEPPAQRPGERPALPVGGVAGGTNTTGRGEAGTRRSKEKRR